MTYDSRNLLSTITLAGSTIDSRSYDTGGRLSSETLGNGQVVTRTYVTGDNLPLAISNSTVGSYTYSWDANKNKTGETITGALSGYTSTMGFDDQNRLTSWSRSNGNSQAWTLSAVNDWQSFSNNGTAVARTHGPTHEVLTVGSATITHDSRGNMTSDEFAIARTYDVDNKVSQSVVPSGSTRGIVGTHTCQYDALGRRVRKTIGGSNSSDTVFALAGEQIIADYPTGTAAASPTTMYLWGSYIDELVCQAAGSSRLYPHRNQQYSTVALSDASGAVTERYVYTSYGDMLVLNAAGTSVLTFPPQTRYTYTGREYDHETETYHFRARIYSATLGRFTGHDPILYPDGYNTYAGCFGVAKMDPSGMDWTWGGFVDGFLNEFHRGVCVTLESKIESYLKTREEREAWHRFTLGNGIPNTISDPNIGNSFNSSDLQGAINSATKICMRNGSPPNDKISGGFGSPYSGALGGASVTLSFRCEGCCVSYTASINDPYDFDSRGVPGFTDRSMSAELKTLLVEASRVASQCGWKTYNNQATWSGSGCYKHAP